MKTDRSDLCGFPLSLQSPAFGFSESNGICSLLEAPSLTMSNLEPASPSNVALSGHLLRLSRNLRAVYLLSTLSSFREAFQCSTFALYTLIEKCFWT